MQRISIVMPVLDEAMGIAAALAALAPLRERGHEVIVVDGGSRDGTPALARSAADRVVSAPRGRASQMNAGSALARGEVLLFLHADTRLPERADALILRGLAASGRAWGRFDVRIAGESGLLPVIAFFMNLRSRATGIATGDQAMFATREAFERAGGFPPLELMEDIALSRSLKRVSPPLCLAERAETSGRRWDRNGALRTVLHMWRLRLGFFLGAAPADLARGYDGGRACRVLVFARAPVPGEVKTRLIPALGEARAAALHRKLVLQCLRAARDSRLGPVELWCAPGADDPFFRECGQRFGASLHAQGSGDLGARMQGAFESALARSRRAILVGSDVPALSPRYLRDADRALAEGKDAVLGPAEDGGYVLIGLSRVDSRLFGGIPWGSADVLAETRRRVAALGWRSQELPALWDLDRPEDLARLPRAMRVQ